ncbi:hypothetical protein VOLCADRAFT_104023 [Volvox carteri f. nagariensis]|uniref:Uncharacterized protein n=1 Tax=Volvox carteri f. nagariensis TaxID=3068 RepID=D8TQR1_VOLCA|nr:uncharacterized protein VOLCADRAFT_104023 [Volvox carteri f. nagariensis]EFJ50198.1 hypothetical protein VOLCADRAFT_104023 [Volvox carteri f. nagariensis]|eukprot:XP_002948818.1 hypothetical protein VOLCADRAFT_104023 [Volvox carteri f. nagariensis]
MEDAKVMELRKAVRQQLQQAGVQGVLHQLLLEYQRTGENVTPEDALDILQPAVETLTLVSNVGPTKPAELPAGKAFLHVKLLGGRAFTDYTLRIPGPEERLQLSLELFGQRFTTHEVPATAEPAFAGEAFFQLPTGPGSVDPLQLLALRQGLHAVVMQLNPLAPWGSDDQAGQRDRGAGPGKAPTAAAVANTPEQVARQLSLELRPAFSAALDEALLKSQQRMEHARDADVMAAFVANAKAWWGDYVSQNLAFKSRPIKLPSACCHETSVTNHGGSVVLLRLRILLSQITVVRCPLRPPGPSILLAFCPWLPTTLLTRSSPTLGRTLANAREAARFVSLLRRREDLAVLPSGGLSEVAECWCLLHTVLASGTASKCTRVQWQRPPKVRDGMGKRMRTTKLTHGAGGDGDTAVQLAAGVWAGRVGGAVRYAITDVDTWPYQSVGCVFNHLRLYANYQCDDSAFGTSYVLEDASLWRELPMPPKELPAMPWSAIPLARSSIPDPLELEAHLEARLRAAAAQHRRQALGAEGTTAWDDSLAQLLMPALAAYEHEAVSGEVAPGNDEFQQAIKRAVPLGWVFKAMPQHHSHVCVDLMRKAMLEEDQMLDILGTTASSVSFALRVKVFVYPECLSSVWMMLAAKYSAVT